MIYRLQFLFLVLFLALIFSTSSELAYATFELPYVVDEKPQVLFSDSVPVSTYYGLENYTQNYVGGYVHITFTYTHSSCCFASFPPKIYVTNVDPRATTTPTIKSITTLLHLLPIPVPPGHATDWYLYDVQFDATGYTLVVNQATTTTEIINEHRIIPSLAVGDWVELANQHPTPGDTESMAFTPVRYMEPPPPHTPVIIIPGIIASRLVDSDEIEIWPNSLLMTFPGGDTYLNDLQMNISGETINNISYESIIRNIGSFSFWSELLSSLVDNLFIEEVDLFENPYDWRLDLNTSAEQLSDKINQIKLQTGAHKVDIVAHSMGGLLVKEYIKKYHGDSIDKFIDIGTPHLGSPKAFKVLMYGDNFGFEKFGFNILNPERVKIISQNMPSIYQLLPSRQYFDDSDIDYKYYVFDAVNGGDRLTFDQTKSYLGTAGRNSSLVNRADEFHQEIDDLNPADYGVVAYNIIGCGTPTIGQFYILDKQGDHYTYNIRMINGDGTVPLKSAEAMPALKTYFVKNAQHAVVPSTSGVKELIANILTGTSTDYDISSYSNITSNSSDCPIPDGTIVSFHSPIELHIYDKSGNHAGLDGNGDIENNIPGVSYEVIEDNKFAFLPNGVEFDINGMATEAGTFDVRIQEIVGGAISTTTLFNNIAITNTSQVTFAIGASIPGNISLDYDGDSIYETNKSYTSISTGFVETAVVPQPASKSFQSIPTASRSGGNKIPLIPIALLETRNLTFVPVVSQTPAVETITKKPIKHLIRAESPEISTTTPQRFSVDTNKSKKIIYKSFVHTFRDFFERMWQWIINRL